MSQLSKLCLAAGIAAGLSMGAASAQEAAVSDPHQWLEAVTDEKALDWVRAQNAEADAYATNNAVSALYHELGHLFVDQFELAILGGEEGVADAIATPDFALGDSSIAEFIIELAAPDNAAVELGPFVGVSMVDRAST